jgi:hypothetical protein
MPIRLAFLWRVRQIISLIAEEAATAAAAAALRHDIANDHSLTAAMQPTRQDLSQRQTPKPSTVVARFQPLDPGIVNEAIPGFFIGRNKEGFWVARDVGGRIGGIFLLENSALAFAKRNSRPAGCATIFLSERFELDLENNGNPLIGHIGSLRRLTSRARRRMTALIANMTKVVKRRLGGFQAF